MLGAGIDNNNTNESEKTIMYDTIDNAQANLTAARAARAEHLALIERTARDYHEAKAKADSVGDLLKANKISPLEAGHIRSTPQSLAALHQSLTADTARYEKAVLDAEVNIVRAQVLDSTSDLMSHDEREHIVQELADTIAPALASAREKISKHNAVMEAAQGALRTHKGIELDGVRLDMNSSVPYLHVDGDTYTLASDNLADSLATELNKRRFQTAWDNR